LLADLLLDADPVEPAFAAALTGLRRLGGEIAGQTLHFLGAGRMIAHHLLGELLDLLALRSLLAQFGNLNFIAGFAVNASGNLLIATRFAALALPLLGLLTLLDGLGLSDLSLLANLALLNGLLAGLALCYLTLGSLPLSGLPGDLAANGVALSRRIALLLAGGAGLPSRLDILCQTSAAQHSDRDDPTRTQLPHGNSPDR
jgi:hypothetical protein